MAEMIWKAITAMALFSAVPAAAQAADPYLWLESVDSPRAMAWVNARNAYSTGVLEADPNYAANYAAALAIGGARDRIPVPSFLGGQIYNFWQDPDHLRGIWRTTGLDDYRTATPNWRTVLDIDALGKAEGKSWVFHGADCLEPEQRFCLIALSDGGEDATTVREFDRVTGKFVDGGFVLPHGKQTVAWEDADHLLVAREWAPGDVTTSGYAFIIKRVTRGAPLSAAVEVFRGTKADTLVQPATFNDGAGHRLTTIVRALDFFHNETFIVGPHDVRRLAIPAKATVADLVAGRIIVKLDEAWTAGGATLPSGSLAQLDLAATLRDPAGLKPSLVLAPGPRDAIEQASATKDALLVTTLDNVRGRAWVFTPTGRDGWSKVRLDLPDNLALGLGATDLHANRAFVTSSGFLTPSTLSLVDAATATLATVKTLPAKFDASGDVVEQREATSTDGTKIPYFVVHRKDIKYDGTTPTLLTAYGGFQVSETPNYSAATGKLWLEKGGALVLANIRGGGEFGPAWHEAGLGVKRQIVYDDFASVARDLIARKITSPRRLGIQGGSNGGLLMGVQFTQHPELWTAVVIQVPLLDMIRIGKIAAGASWAGEYGDVDADPAVMAFWQKTSPYQNLRAGVAYPEPFIFTTTKDDRVGPQHARKFAARMEELGYKFFYYENTEGGHGAGADLKQAAHATALTMTYLQKKLMDR
jgi:prolyl oligopeptidase